MGWIRAGKIWCLAGIFVFGVVFWIGVQVRRFVLGLVIVPLTKCLIHNLFAMLVLMLYNMYGVDIAILGII
jgi:hypothetical protein